MLQKLVASRAAAPAALMMLLAAAACYPSKDNRDQDQGDPSESTTKVETYGHKLAPPTPAPAVAKAAKDFRMSLRSKFNDGFIEYLQLTKSTGPYVLQATIALDSLKSIIDEQSGFYFRVAGALGSDTGSSARILAVRKNSINGFVLRAQLSNGATPAPVEIDSTPEVDVRFEQTSNSLALLARKTPSLGQTPPWITLYSTTIGAPASFSVSYGFEHLNKNGKFFINRVALEGAGVGKSVEGPILASVRSAADATNAAISSLKSDPIDAAAASASISAAIINIQEAADAVAAAVTAGTLQTSTKDVWAGLFLKKAQQLLPKAKTAADSGSPKKALAQVKALETCFENCIAASVAYLGRTILTGKNMRNVYLFHADAGP